jgi:hypothetical protein
MLGRLFAKAGLAASLLTLTAYGAAGIARSQGAPDVPMCCAEPAPAVEQAMATLAITVRLAGGGGPPPPPGMAPTGPLQMGGAAGVTVQAVPAGTAGTLAVEAVTDSQGQTALDVPAGQYWVIVPVAGQHDGRTVAGALVTELPNGVRVHAGQEVTVGAGETVPVALGMRIMLP